MPYGDAAIAAGAALICGGGIVAVATETVYGLAGDARSADAVAAIYAAKGRPDFNPLIVHVLDLAAAEQVAVFDPRSRALAERFWPGPLTLVLPLRADAGIATLATAGLATVALRVPAHRVIRALLDASATPLAAPSANASGGISPTCAAHVAASLAGRIPLVIDDGRTRAGVESTIVAGVAILRPGPVTVEQLAPYGIGTGAPGGGIVAPGQLASHYAPAKPLRLNAAAATADEWLIGFGAVAGDDTLSRTGDLSEAAANLFDALHRADACRRTRIAVAPVPAKGIGVAINDRLARAAHR